jgi:hypothetical protein
VRECGNSHSQLTGIAGAGIYCIAPGDYHYFSLNRNNKSSIQISEIFRERYFYSNLASMNFDLQELPHGKKFSCPGNPFGVVEE